MRKKQNQIVLKICLSAMFLALGYVLPFLTGNIPEIGQMLLPMHIPVLLCGMTCGWQYGGVIGFVLPLFRSLTVGKPAIYPMAAGMAAELLTYGLVIGIVYCLFKKKTLIAGYTALVSAMVAGRVVWGAARALMAGISELKFTFSAFMAGALLEAFPGIILQLVLIPPIMLLLEKSDVMKKLNH